MNVLLTGGTGRLGQRVLSRPLGAPIAWRVLSRHLAANTDKSAVADLVTGNGLPEALAGIDAVLHLASDPAQPSDDIEAAKHLVGAASQAGVRHLVFLSIIGVGRIPYPYYEAKLAAEHVVAAGRVPWTILRAAQFHSFVDWLLGKAARVPGLIIVPAGFTVQSVADDDIADRLVRVLLHGPSGRARDFAGPEVLDVVQAAQTWQQARQLRRAVVPIPVPGRVARAFRRGANTAPDGDRGLETWSSWLQRRYAGAPNPRLQQPRP